MPVLTHHALGLDRSLQRHRALGRLHRPTLTTMSDASNPDPNTLRGILTRYSSIAGEADV